MTDRRASRTNATLRRRAPSGARNPRHGARTLDTHVSRIRNKLGLTPENGWRLAAVYRYGYRLEQLDAAVPRTPRTDER